MGKVVELHPYLIPFARLEGLSCFMTLAMREIQQPICNTQDGTVGGHFSQTDSDHRHRLIDAQIQFHDRCAQDLKAFGEGIAIKDKRAAVIGSLIAWHFPIRAESAPFSGPDPGCLW